MAFPKIGAITFVHLGETIPVGQFVENVTRKNVNGSATQRFATGGEEESVRAIADIVAANAAALDAYIKSVKALQGTVVTVVTNSQISRTNMTVLSVKMPQTQEGGADNPLKTPLNVGGINGTAATHILSFDITLLDGSVAP